MTDPQTSVRFASDCFELTFERRTGVWQALTYRGCPLLAGGRTAGLDVNLADRRLGWPRLVGSRQEALPHGVRATLEYVLVPQGGASSRPEYRVTETFDLLSDPDRIERRVLIRRGPCAGGAEVQPDRLLSVSLLVDGLAAGEPRRTLFSIPMARFSPGAELISVLRRGRDFAGVDGADDAFDVRVTAGDLLAGTVGAYRPDPPLSVAITPLPRECPVRIRLFGREGRAVVEHEFACESWLTDAPAIQAAAQVIHASAEAWPRTRVQVGRHLQAHGCSPPDDRPAWAKSAVVFEAEPKFHGGLRALAARLPEVRRLGFNTVYLMPWHRGGYGTIDYLEVDPELGTFDDLKHLTGRAHALGMRVLFDLLVNIAADASPYAADHPDWFYRDAAGRLLPHPAWKNNCFDPASPGFRRFLIDYAVRCCREWGADGFRVDAVAYRGGLWNNLPGLQPHQHAHAVFPLVGEIRRAIRAGDPDRILMAECFGPQQVPVSDLVCFQWITWLDWALERLLSGRLDGAAVREILADHFAVLPPGTWLATYTHTHDTVAFLKRDLDGPPVAALLATLVLLSAGAMVFGGGWGMRPRPGAEEAGEYRALFAAKTRLGGVAGGEVEFRPSDDPALLVAERPSAAGRVRVTTNFSGEPRRAAADGTVIYSRLGSEPPTVGPYDTVVVRPA